MNYRSQRSKQRHPFAELACFCEKSWEWAARKEAKGAKLDIRKKRDTYLCHNEIGEHTKP